MKTMNLTFEDSEFTELEEVRKEFPECKKWEKFFVELARRRKKK
jgi:hypothetical protein